MHVSKSWSDISNERLSIEINVGIFFPDKLKKPFNFALPNLFLKKIEFAWK